MARIEDKIIDKHYVGLVPGGGGAHSSKIYMGRLRPEVQTLTLLRAILDRKGTPFRIPSIENCTPFIYLQSDVYQIFHLRNPLRAVGCVFSRYLRKSHLIPK